MPRAHDGRTAFVVKWVASVMQIAGYTATGFDWTPWNAWLFLGGVAGWLAVGVLWNDRALMLIHAVAPDRDARRVVESMSAVTSRSRREIRPRR